MAATNKCLAQRNKTRPPSKATKRRGRASTYRDAIPASVFGRLYARNKIGIGVVHENVPEIGDARDGAHRSGRRLRGGLVGGPIGNHQEAQQEPQRILDPVEFFDKTTGKVKVWYWRAESAYEFYDAPGFHPRTGQALTGVTLDVITEWQQISEKREAVLHYPARRACAGHIPRPPAWD